MDDDGWIQYADEPPHPAPPKPKHDIQLPNYKIPVESERYRVSPVKVFREPYLPEETAVQKFRFRTRIVSARGVFAHSNYPNVRHLRLHPSSVQRFINVLTDLIPKSIGLWIRSILPEWFIPTNIILKTEKREHRELFDTEVRAYMKLNPLQGVVVPTCYGLARYNGMRCLLLQDVGGTSLAEQAGLTLDLKELSRLLQDCHRKLQDNGCTKTTLSCPTRLIGDRVVALDFEMVAFNRPKDVNALFTKTNMEYLTSRYRPGAAENGMASRQPRGSLERTWQVEDE